MCNEGTLHAMKACRGVDKYLYSSLTSARDRQVVSPTDSANALEKTENLQPLPGIKS